MSLEEKILADYKEAMKQRDSARSSILSFLRASLANAAIEKPKDGLEDSDVMAVIKKHIKKCQDSIEQFKTGNRQDLVDKEAGELKILQSYLPPQLNADELARVIESVISQTGATSIKQMGQVMKEVIAKVKGKADGKQISELVKKALGGTKPEEKETEE